MWRQDLDKLSYYFIDLHKHLPATVLIHLSTLVFLHLLGRKWHALDRTEQAKYYEMARKERALHMQRYPGWSARDNYAQVVAVAVTHAVALVVVSLLSLVYFFWSRETNNNQNETSTTAKATATLTTTKTATKHKNQLRQQPHAAFILSPISSSHSSALPYRYRLK